MRMKSIGMLRRSILTGLVYVMMSGSFAAGIGSASPNADSEGGAERSATASPAAAIVDDFEQTSLLTASSVSAKSASIGLVSRPEAIRYGYHAIRLAYDFTDMGGTSAAYVNFKDPGGGAGRTIPGNPAKIGIWVYTEGNTHWLRAQIQDAAGSKTAIDLSPSAGYDLNGSWKYLTATIPGTAIAPIKLNQIYIAETNAVKKNSGSLYFDRLSAFYSNSTVHGLDIVDLPPLQAGGAKQAQVFATYANASEPVRVTSGIVFESSNPEVATIDSSGMVQALQPGTATITASYGTAPQAVYELTVTDHLPVPGKLEHSSKAVMERGTTNQIRVYAAYAGMPEPVTVLTGATFQSSASDIAAVDAGGQVTALKSGTATITIGYAGASTAYVLTVKEPVPVLQSIKLTGPSAMTIGDTERTEVFGTYTWIGNPVAVTSGVTYASSNPGAATVDAEGRIAALAAGATRITAKFEGKQDSIYVVVNKVASIPKSELRAAWIATVDNVDWPKKGVTDPDQQKGDFTELLDQLQDAGMNAVVVQVKPTADAFYPSQFGPWSKWLTGVQGQDPGYNPLAFMLEEVHERNMEFHAWFNPYRISLDDDIDQLTPDHPARLHPDWVVSYGGKLYFDPGNPEAMQFIIDGIMEVVDQYDIDAVHFDDYFYPYPVSGVDFPDQATYEQYGAGFASKADWRRNNVNTFVRRVSEEIKQRKSYVKFGISPFGIWKNKSQDPQGSETNGLSSYNDIYADSKRWVEEEWIDYMTPQIYWYMGYSAAAYDKLAEWWSGVAAGKNVHLYVGHAAYRIGAGDPAWDNPDEMPNQIAYNRNFDSIKGSTFFSAAWLPANPLGFTDRLKNDLYRYPALVPAMPWLDNTAPEAPLLTKAVRKAAGIELTWTASDSDAAYYVVYRFAGDEAGSVQDATKIVATIRKQEGQIQRYVDRNAAAGGEYAYVVTAVDRLHNESAGSRAVSVTDPLDTTPPVTAASVAGTQNNGWYVSEAVVQLAASDEGTGVKATEFSMDDGANWQLYAAPISLTDDGVHTLQYRSIDHADNIEQPGALTVRIDRSAPEISFNGDLIYSVDQKVQIGCTASDTVSGVVYDPCTTLLVDAFGYELGLGDHTVTASAQDAAGNAANASVTYTIQANVDSLSQLVDGFVTGPGANGIRNALKQKLAHGQLGAFINQVEAQSGKSIAKEHADALIRLAKSLIP